LTNQENYEYKDLGKYTLCMEEVKKRNEAIGEIISGIRRTTFPITDLEFISLNIRKCLELISLANLVAHKEKYKEAREKYFLDWRAKAILKEIEKINPDFYPEPLIRVKSSTSPVAWEWKKRESGYLSRDEFSEAYNFASDFLHAENPFNKKDIDFFQVMKKFNEYNIKIIGLLNEHVIKLSNGIVLNCLMSTIEDGRVQLTIFEKVEREIEKP